MIPSDRWQNMSFMLAASVLLMSTAVKTQSSPEFVHPQLPDVFTASEILRYDLLPEGFSGEADEILTAAFFRDAEGLLQLLVTYRSDAERTSDTIRIGDEAALRFRIEAAYQEQQALAVGRRVRPQSEWPAGVRSGYYFAASYGYPNGLRINTGWHLGKVLSLGLEFGLADSWSGDPGTMYIGATGRFNLPVLPSPWCPFVTASVGMKPQHVVWNYVFNSYHGAAYREFTAGILYAVSQFAYLRGEIGAFYGLYNYDLGAPTDRYSREVMGLAREWHPSIRLGIEAVLP